MKNWMQVAIEEAWKAYEDGEVPVGAVLVRNETLIWQDHNRNISQMDPTAHAEILCIRHASSSIGSRYLKDCTLFVTLEPCAMCSGAIIASRVGRCVYGVSDPIKGCCGSVYDLPADPAFQSYVLTEQGNMEQECSKPLRLFFSKKR